MDGGYTQKNGGSSTPLRRSADPRSGAEFGQLVEGVVLAGVHAWGECVLETITCRPLFPVAGWPLISHTLAWLRDGGITRASVCANSDTGSLRASLGDGDQLRLSIHYYEDKMPRGPAGCARDAVIGSAAEVFVVVEGTVVPNLDMPALIQAHRAAGSVLTVVVADGDGPRRGVEVGSHRLEPLGVYIFSRSVLDHIPPTGYQDIKESLIPQLYAKGHRVGTFVVGRGDSPRVTNAASYMAVSKWAVERLSNGSQTPDGYVRFGEAIVHESARLHNQARFIGPVLIGPRCRIEEGAIVIGPTTIGADCTIGSQAVVSRSILWNECRVGERATLDHCILTSEATVDPDVVVRETVCLARPPKRSWWTRLRSLFHRARSARRAVSYVSASGPPLSLPSKLVPGLPTPKPVAKRPNAYPTTS